METEKSIKITNSLLTPPFSAAILAFWLQLDILHDYIPPCLLCANKTGGTRLVKFSFVQPAKVRWRALRRRVFQQTAKLLVESIDPRT